jgi:hypothetical protein
MRNVVLPNNWPRAVALFLIANVRRVLYVVRFLLGNSPASEFFICRHFGTFCSIFVGTHRGPRPLCGLLPLHYLLCNRTYPYSVTLLTIGSGYFRAKTSPVWILQQFSNLVNLHQRAYEDGTDSVFRNVGIWNSDAGELPRRKHTGRIFV